MSYQLTAPTREEINAIPGALLLEFGTDWCGHCQAAAPHVEAALRAVPNVRRLKIEDGPGRPLGRSFHVKLWPTLIVLQNGVELARLVRPTSQPPIDAALTRLA